jgi:hypothetical protein
MIKENRCFKKQEFDSNEKNRSSKLEENNPENLNR